MKYILVTDTHLGVKQGSPLYHSVTDGLFANIYDYAENNGIEFLIHLGDFWDNRKSVSIKTVLQGLYIAGNLNKVFKHSYILTGNHDTIYKDSNDESLLTMFNKFENITIINRPFELDNMLLVPWLFPNELLENEDNNRILLGHFDIAGAVMNESGTESRHGIRQSDFTNWDLVLSGHYHTPGKYGNIQYLGSPFHTSFNDVAGTRGFYILDSEACTTEFIEFTDYPKFVRVKTTDDIASNKIKGNIVELIFTEDYGINKNIEIIENYKKHDPLTLTPKYVNISESMSDEVMAEEDIEIKDHLGILFEYLEQSELPEHMNLDMIKKVAENIYKETVNEK